ncbi:MAG TPA: hypothetical protein VEC36_11420 [Patescibacteria group bacterium]|nr:hypothetical protein [Patescibacteria group bacterium]
MNERIFDIFLERGELKLTPEDITLLKKFFHYLDVNSLFLRSYEIAAEPIFIISDDAIRYRFTLSEIKNMWDSMKGGNRIEWEKLPFEYVAGSDAQKSF